MNIKRILLLLLFFALCQNPAYASPWAKKEGYLERTGGKFAFGLKHSLCSWMSLWTESREPGYKKQWEGFSAGFGKTVVYTAGGLVQLVTFPIPADFPDFGIGMHIPSKECPARHDKNYVPPAKNPLSKTSAPDAKPVLKPLTSPSNTPAPAAVPETAKPEPIIVETKIPETPVPAVSEKSELEKAQEAELEAAASAAVSSPAETEEPVAPLESDIETEDVVQPTLSKEEAADEKIHETNEDIISANPETAAAASDDEEEDLWDDEYDAVDERSAQIDSYEDETDSNQPKKKSVQSSLN